MASWGSKVVDGFSWICLFKVMFYGVDPMGIHRHFSPPFFGPKMLNMNFFFFGRRSKLKLFGEGLNFCVFFFLFLVLADGFKCFFV